MFIVDIIDCIENPVARFLLKVTVPIFVIALVVLLFVAYFDGVAQQQAQKEQIVTFSAGEIVDKQIRNPTSGWFTSRPTEYYITIEINYVYKEKERSTTRKYSVSEEVYRSYNIGDVFDSQNF